MIKKKILLFLLTLIAIVGCTSEEELSWAEQYELDYPQQVGERRERRIHADRFNFWTFIRVDEISAACLDATMLLSTARYSGFNRDFVIQFVSDEFEALNYISESVVPVWPSRYTVRILYSLNHFVREEGIDTTEFNLKYPITIADLIDNWENVRDLYENFEWEIRNEISSLSFYINRILSTVSDEQQKLDYAVYWWFRYPFIERPPLESSNVRNITATSEIIRRYAWHVNEHGIENSEIIFVLTREEAIALEREVFALNLSESTASDSRLEMLNIRINDGNRKENINLEYFSLAYPITRYDLVNNWESVNALMNYLDN